MKTETLKQTVRFQASAKEVFDLFMDAKKHRLFTGSPAVISRKEGGKFSTYAGMCHGRNIEIVEGEKIVQAWRAEDWPSGVYSLLTLKLIPQGDHSSRLEVLQTAVPGQRNLEKIKQGWNEHYWGPMKAYFKQQNGQNEKHKITMLKDKETSRSGTMKIGRTLRRVA
ncbi:MAG: SRPBCC domain-containing protein [Oligoflexales bacterium]